MMRRFKQQEAKLSLG